MSAAVARPSPAPRAEPSRILIIKLSALGDFVQALGPMKAIRDYHAGAHITLLTTPPYAELARASGWFDDIWSDGRPDTLAGGWRLIRRLRRGAFARVYDLQTSGRTDWYFQLLRPHPPEWSGTAFGCSHPHANPRRAQMHTIERQAEQLLMAGIPKTPPPDVSFVPASAMRFDLPRPYALMVPGGAEHRPEKRWPVENYAVLAEALLFEGLNPVVIGGPQEETLAEIIGKGAPQALSLVGRTSIVDIAALARGAALAVGNDTGPMHLIAVAGCPSVVLFSQASDPKLCGQRGRDVRILRRPALKDLPVDAVIDALPEVAP
jgi:ADP-heptose:LPS heptosyltransferase